MVWTDTTSWRSGRERRPRSGGRRWADLAVGWPYVDQCLTELVAGELSTERASIAKLWVTPRDRAPHLIARERVIVYLRPVVMSALSRSG